MKSAVKTYQQKRVFEGRYRWFSGSFAWVLHRVTGLALILYLAVHVLSVSTLARGADEFNALMKLYASPMFKIGEVLIWGAFVFHALNGVRVVWMDFWGGSMIHKKLFVAVFAVSALVFVAGAYGMLRHSFGG